MFIFLKTFIIITIIILLLLYVYFESTVHIKVYKTYRYYINSNKK